MLNSLKKKALLGADMKCILITQIVTTECHFHSGNNSDARSFLSHVCQMMPKEKLLCFGLTCIVLYIHG